MKKKFLGLFGVLFLSVGLLVACSGGDDAAESGLVGTWEWGVDSSFQITFEEDGTGYWRSHMGDFDWNITRNGELRMSGPSGMANWEFEINGDELRIIRTDPGIPIQEDYIYVRAR